MTKKLNTWLGGIFAILLLISCDSQDSDIQELKASFTVQSKEVEIGTTVNFSDTSEGTDETTEYIWDFGDGANSTLKAPTHVYTEIGEGSYLVTLTLRRNGEVVTTSQELLVFLSNNIDGRITLLERLDENEIIVCAHRAKNELDAPENSIAAINNIISKGIEMIEVDVRVTSDGELVLMHDKTIDRTTEGSGNVSDFTLEELKGFRLFNDNGVLTEERIPTLREVLSLVRGRLYIDLDIANKVLFDRIYPVINQYGMLKQVIFYTSDDVSEVNRMIASGPDAIPMPLVDSQSDFDTYSNLDLNVAHYTSASFTQSLVQQAKDKGWSIFMNAYVNSTTPEEDNFSRIDRIIALEGNIVQTDYPVSVKQHIN
ncbi:hypothetical protein MTsPCn9_25620 [Croceitalea sp. MTPC9]|uniref:glycerophosphodiester phosphodiesterase family protein n=1 Tax=unclassified Croceitalea TaxID=2632280 RepID=UPI002B3E123B|nr:hypothetical protein MTsPCn6_28910 [Croceitalea sp. MTPC6]GMN17624.1 hypothetical protein MTsPCn9_25620 [Croceitalea sp. MTPC9]